MSLFCHCLNILEKSFVITRTSDIVIGKRNKDADNLARYLENGGIYFMSFGPRDRNNELTANEELEILEAYQSADEYLDMGGNMDDFFFESEE